VNTELLYVGVGTKGPTTLVGLVSLRSVVYVEVLHFAFAAAVRVCRE
jgi:hypothetical protein